MILPSDSPATVTRNEEHCGRLVATTPRAQSLLAQHFDQFPTTTPQLWHVATTLHAPRTRRRWSDQLEASVSRLTTITTQRSMDLCKDPRTMRPRRVSTPSKPALPRGLQTSLRALAELAPRVFAEDDRESCHQPCSAAPLQREGYRSSLRSAQRRRAAELCAHRLVSRSVTFLGDVGRK